MHGETVIGGLIAFSVTKKLAVYGLARYYGFARLYRRFARASRASAPTRERAAQLNVMVREAIRLPNRMVSRVRAAQRRVPGEEVGRGL